MVLILDDDQGVTRVDFIRHIPGCGSGSGAPSHSQTRALPERVKREPAMFADDDALGGLDRSRLGAQMSAQELLEWPLADEADAGAVRFVEYRQAGRMRHPAYLRFLQTADGKQRFRKRGNRHVVQKVALILRRIRTLQQFRIRPGAADLRIVAGRDPRGAQALHVFQADAEFDLAIAKHIGVRCPARAVFAQEVAEDALAILGGKADAVQGNAQGIANPARILKIGRGGAVAVVVLPVGHEEALHGIPGIAQQQSGDRRVDAAGHTDDDGAVGRRIGEALLHPPIIRAMPEDEALHEHLPHLRFLHARLPHFIEEVQIAAHHGRIIHIRNSVPPVCLQAVYQRLVVGDDKSPRAGRIFRTHRAQIDAAGQPARQRKKAVVIDHGA